MARYKSFAELKAEREAKYAQKKADKQAKRDAKHAAQVQDQPERLASYTVAYRGGLPGMPRAKSGGITLQVCSDRFELIATRGGRGYWDDVTIPYAQVQEVVIADRQVSTFEAIAGGLNSRQLNQKNNLHVTFESEGVVLVLRLEMLSEVTVPAQARKCAELQDLLRTNAIPAQFRPVASR